MNVDVNLTGIERQEEGGDRVAIALHHVGVSGAECAEELLVADRAAVDEEILREAIAASGFDPRLSYAERQRRQQDMLQTLRRANGLGGEDKQSVPQVTVALRAYLQRSIHSPNPAYRAYVDKEIAENCKTLARLHNSTTAQQRERAVRRLAGYERDARELAARL